LPLGHVPEFYSIDSRQEPERNKDHRNDGQHLHDLIEPMGGERQISFDEVRCQFVEERGQASGPLLLFLILCQFMAAILAESPVAPPPQIRKDFFMVKENSEDPFRVSLRAGEDRQNPVINDFRRCYTLFDVISPKIFPEKMPAQGQLPNSKRSRHSRSRLHKEKSKSGTQSS